MKYTAIILLLFLTQLTMQGQIWTRITMKGNMNKIAFNGQIGVAVGDHGVLYKTNNGGKTFYSVQSYFSEDLVDVKYIGNETFMACGYTRGDGGIIIKSDDNGENWSTVLSFSGSYNELFNIFTSDNKNIFVSGTRQLIITRNAFNSYSITNFVTGTQLRAVKLYDTHIFMASGDSVVMRKSSSTIYLTGCSQQPTSQSLKDMVIYKNKIYAIGDGGAYCNSDSGDLWNMISTQNLDYISLHVFNDTLYTATRSNLYKINESGNLEFVYNSSDINSIGNSERNLFVLGKNYIAYKEKCLFTLPVQPADQTVELYNSTQFIVKSSESNAGFQWQSDKGKGFQNMSNNGIYTGVKNDTLILSSVTLNNNYQKFRCIVNVNNCTDTSAEAQLTVLLRGGIGNSTQHQSISLYPNPATDYINIEMGSGMNYQIRDATNRILLEGNIKSHVETIDLSTLPNGTYIIRLGLVNKIIYIVGK